MLRPFSEIAMAPDIVETLEVGGWISPPFGIVPDVFTKPSPSLWISPRQEALTLRAA